MNLTQRLMILEALIDDNELTIDDLETLRNAITDEINGRIDAEDELRDAELAAKPPSPNPVSPLH